MRKKASHAHCPRSYIQIVDSEHNNDISLVVYHHSKKHPHKNFDMDVAEQHLELSIAENWIRKTDTNTLGRQNLIVANLTFVISIGNLKDNAHVRRGISFPIKVPGKNYYNFDSAVRDIAIQAKEAKEAFEHATLLQERYNKGKALTGDDVCGNRPKFDGASTNEQFLRHSEQALYTYLSTKQGVSAIVNRLTAEIRALDLMPYGSTVKIYGVILHIHSTKSTCGVCEISTIGMQNSQHPSNKETAQFLKLLADELQSRETTVPNKPPSAILYTYPGATKVNAPLEKRGIKMGTIFTSNTHDKDHKVTPNAKNGVNRINLKDILTQKKIFVANFKRELSEEYLEQHEPDLFDRTVFASASDTNPYTRKATDRIAEVRKQEDGTFEGLCKLFTEKVAITAKPKVVAVAKTAAPITKPKVPTKITVPNTKLKATTKATAVTKAKKASA